MCGGIHPAMGSYAAAIQGDLTLEMALDDHSVTDHDILPVRVRLFSGPFPKLQGAFPSCAIISERSSPARVRFAAPIGAPLTAAGRSQPLSCHEGKAALARVLAAAEPGAARPRHKAAKKRTR